MATKTIDRLLMKLEGRGGAEGNGGVGRGGAEEIIKRIKIN